MTEYRDTWDDGSAEEADSRLNDEAMRRNHACARVSEDDQFMIWLAEFDPQDGHGPLGVIPDYEAQLFAGSVVRAAFAAGRLRMGDAERIKAAALIDQAARQFRFYEEAHNRKFKDACLMCDAPAAQEAQAKAATNAVFAEHLEAWLDAYPVVLPKPEYRGNLKPVDGPLSDPAMIDGLLNAIDDIATTGTREPHRPDGVADLLAFRINAPDPRFDPSKPVTVNGYLYRPVKEVK